jgi:cellulose synthase/poly-beta-1,6-N-acetylglucosamine synthase-like glycosyltransferase
MLDVSICVCAYNEEQNIKRTIDALLNQHHNKTEIKEIIVVSASKDNTNKIVEDISKNNNTVKLIIENERNGKASSINIFIKEAKYDICVLISADVVPHPDAIEYLCLPFLNEEDKIGMTGSRVIPSNNIKTFMGFIGHTEWQMAHKLSLRHPKLGECIAFRKVVSYVNPSIDPRTSVDEAYLEYRITDMGYKLKYVPESIVYNKTSETLTDAIKQRRRIYAGHIRLKRMTNYRVSSMDMDEKGKLALEVYWEYARGFFWMPLVVAIELFCMVLGMWDYVKKKEDIPVWKISKSTKEVEVDRIKEV